MCKRIIRFFQEIFRFFQAGKNSRIGKLISQHVGLGGKIKISRQGGKETLGTLAYISPDYKLITVIKLDDGQAEVIREEDIYSFSSVANFTTEATPNPSINIPQEPVSSPSIIEPSQPVSPTEALISKNSSQVFEITGRFKGKLSVAKIELKEPDFVFPSQELSSRFIKNWDRIKNRYDNAKKINELSPRFNRIQQIINDLETLKAQAATSLAVKRHLAYCYYLSNQKRGSLKYYQELAQSSFAVDDWFNTAVVAWEDSEKLKLAFYSLKQVFKQVRITEEIEAWYIYVNLLTKFSNYHALRELWETTARQLDREEINLLFETGIYLLTSTGDEKSSTELFEKSSYGQSLQPLLLEMFDLIEQKTEEEYYLPYQRFELSYSQSIDKKAENKNTFPESPEIDEYKLTRIKGYIYKYNKVENYGFLKDTKGKEYFFHRSAILDEELDEIMEKTNFTPSFRFAVGFDGYRNHKGLSATNICLLDVTTPELLDQAIKYSRQKNYGKAIQLIKLVLIIEPEHPQAQELYQKWLDYERRNAPKGSNPFDKAKRSQINKNYEEAITFYRRAIEQGDRLSSAINDLAALLEQLGRPQEAIEVIEKNRHRVTKQQPLDNSLEKLYRKTEQYDKAIKSLRRLLDSTSNQQKQAVLFWKLGNCYLNMKNFSEAEKQFKRGLELEPSNIVAKRNFALCVAQQQRYDQAKSILREILNSSNDTKSQEILSAIEKTEIGDSAQLDNIYTQTILSDEEIATATGLSDFDTGGLSRFAEFFLSRCPFDGVVADRVKIGAERKEYIGLEKDAKHDLDRLEDAAKNFGTRNPRERGKYYLSAARIVLDTKDNPNRFYKYLCRTFASRGDATVVENQSLDTAREWYCEALRIYDGVPKGKYDERDAFNALVRYLYSTLGRDAIPMQINIPKIDETLQSLIEHHPELDKLFDTIAYLVFHSPQFAGRQILNRLYDKESFRKSALQYLNKKGIAIKSLRDLKDFVDLWDELRNQQNDAVAFLSGEFSLLVNLELTTAWLASSIERINTVMDRLFFELDRQRVQELQKILELALEFCRQNIFEERERFCIQIDNSCQNLLVQIEENPTRLSIEQIYQPIERIKEKMSQELIQLYETAKPQVALRLPEGASHTPDNNQQIGVQIVIVNQTGRSPAESLEIFIQENEDYFTVSMPEVKLEESLRGGEQKIKNVSLRLTNKALQSQSFSLELYAQYRTRSDEVEQTSVSALPIRLYAKEEFQEFDNPYASYAEGGIVGDPKMFFGREELINNIAVSIQESHLQSKCVIVFGQKRAGKSSILYHLKGQLEEKKNLLILDVGNIGSILALESSTSFLHQILWQILSKLKYAIEDRVDEGASELNIDFPEDLDFYSHPNPLGKFTDIFDRYQRLASKKEDWHNLRLVLLIDEFSYIYDKIVTGKIPPDFMKNWKALLQNNYFHAVLAGQDVMPKFKQQFPNEFGVAQDERVTYLREEYAIGLIEDPIRIGGLQGESRYREKAIERILELTAGSPFYIQIICNRLVEYMNRKHTSLVTEADVELIKTELIQGVNALGLDKFDNLINSGDTSKEAISDADALQVLKAIAFKSRIGGLCHRSNIVCETTVSTELILSDLEARDIIGCDRGEYYKIKVGLFAEWLLING